MRQPDLLREEAAVEARSASLVRELGLTDLALTQIQDASADGGRLGRPAAGVVHAH